MKNNISNLALKTAQNVCAVGDVGGIEHNAKTIQFALDEATKSSPQRRNGATLYVKTVREVALELGISKTTVSKLEKRALNKLRKALLT